MTSRAEASIAQMREAMAFYYWLDLDALSEARLGVTFTQLPPVHLILPRIVSIAEDFARALLLEASEALVDTTHPLRLDIWSQAEERAESTWESIRNAWKLWHGVDLSQAPMDLRFRGFVEARNAIIHGLGQLTRRQSRNDEALKKTVSRLGHAHLRLDGRRLVLPSNTVDEAVETCAGLVEWLDHQTVSKGIVALS